MRPPAAEIVKWLILKLLVLIDLCRRTVRPVRGRIIASGPGRQDAGSRRMLCVLAHFDRDGVVDNYVVHYLRALDALGCETVVVSTAETLDGANIRKILPFCSKYIVKQNIGYDFASWRTGLAAVDDLSRYDRVIIANDSVYGPLQDLNGVFAEMAERKVSFWGITDSLKYGRHLQSYFLVFEGAVAMSGVFREFWRKLPDYRHKYAVIIQAEVGLTRRLAAAGFDFAAYRPVEEVQQSVQKEAGLAAILRDPRISPTHRGWKSLVRAGCPFLKIQLLRDNPMQVPDFDTWEAVLVGVSAYDPRLIKTHLARVKRNEARVR